MIKDEFTIQCRLGADLERDPVIKKYLEKRLKKEKNVDIIRDIFWRVIVIEKELPDNQ